MFKWLISLIALLSLPVMGTTLAQQLVDAALARTEHTVIYNGAYFALDYPNGDVPEHFGVCTDVLIRTYRKLGIDLQVLVHEDMQQHFSLYPSKRIWGLNRTDRNIDHRRVPNLQVFFSRHGESLPISDNASSFLPGDIVSWMLPGNLPHIGIVSDQFTAEGIPQIVHNIGLGPQLNDMLFNYPITGHYRYLPSLK
ncbi:DUF1287 domain-containing protein [Agarivorans aestuarii]|uniref:DUF1287 domain-containing protein n=1 Tax=Agarivorans aestuarii TaxID=1563703 RepID=A0ABU7G6W9_9ALTE|nr:DUF1287 domain-containing protein [Agarivorans aestuarii]MEE1675141.1 DUF1287 domain-containing protein [Agarivorans aestuarii]